MNWGIKEYFFLEISESRELKHLLQSIIAGGAVRSVVSLAGIKNISSKVLGTKNQASNVYATIEALKRLAARYEREKYLRGKK